MNYSEQLKSPMWQKKRLEIMQKDNFTCQICGDTKNTLHVHHLYYEKGNKIYDYPDKCLITLCENCHKNEHDMQNNSLKDISYYIGKRGITMFEIFAIIELIDVNISGYGNLNFITETFGNSAGQYSENELKILEDRRNGI